MAVALSKRLADQKDEVLRFTKRYGRYAAMDKFSVADTLAFDKLLTEWTGDEKYGYHPEINLSSSRSIGEQLADALVGKIVDLQNQNKELTERLNFYISRDKESHNKSKAATEIDRILSACEMETADER